MAAAGDCDYFGTCWRSPQSSDQPPSVGGENEISNLSSTSQDTRSPAPTPTPMPIIITTSAPAFSAGNTVTSPTGTPTSSSTSSVTSLIQIITSVNGSSNPFSITAPSGSTGGFSSTRSSASSERDRRAFHPKGSGTSSSNEHSVKGGKTAKRGKVTNPKLRVLSFADIENGLSCFGQSASSWAETLAELSPDRLLSMGDHHDQGYSWDETGGGAGKRTKISHPSSSHAMTSWDIDGGLAADFDGSLSGLGTELGTSSYNMSEALLALPVFKQENLENGFQYILGAATSPAVKMNEETLTYLNQGQSYEIKVKKLGDLSEYQGKCLRSVVKVQFHERRLQYMEREQMEQWKQNRPGERILDVDVPLSYGLVDVNLDPSRISQIEFIWDPTKETGMYFKVHAISTEFTAKKHGGEKGVPFRVQIETYTHNDGDGKLLHAASCQIKVFKPKGADRKHKTDREKMEKRSEAEKEKYQPSYECTVLTEVPLDQVSTSLNSFGIKGPASLTTSFSELTCDSGSVASPIVPAVTSPQPSTPSRSLAESPLSASPAQQQQPVPQHPPPPELVASSPTCAGDSKSFPLSGEATAAEVKNWFVYHRFSNYTRIFQNFSGADLLRLNRDDLIQICGLADGIRLNNALQSKSVRPRLTIFICQEPESVYHAVYMDCVGVVELKCKLASLFGIQATQIGDIFMLGPSSIHVMVTDEVLQNTQDQSRFVVEGMREETGDKYRILLKSMQ
ncbi:transcription factor CP2-like isoform X2 [Littorina saxatilis]|uniref:transcription factor CP2-like isoform X2 n=1 Tax=Littorina saxatilis TaxID=31220 RepID=UPI0038B6705E